MSDRMTHDERVHYHTYTTCETPAEHAERIVKLEELCEDLMGWVCCLQLGGKLSRDNYVALEDRMSELGLVVE